jgi:hypothetical protein
MEPSLPASETEQQQQLPPQRPPMSIAARLLNVFAIPGEVFDEVKAARTKVSNWLVPVFLSAVIGALSVSIAFAQPAVQQQLREQQTRVLDKQVKAGSITQADADKLLATLERAQGPLMTAGVVALSFLRIFWWALILLLLGRWFFRASFGYAKALEVAGLALMISVLGSVVSLLLTVNLARLFATPSLALAVHDFDTTRKSHVFLGAANVFAFWQISVIAVGLAKLAGAPFFRAVMLVLACWLLQESVLIMLGFGQLALNMAG